MGTDTGRVIELTSRGTPWDSRVKESPGKRRPGSPSPREWAFRPGEGDGSRGEGDGSRGEGTGSPGDGDGFPCEGDGSPGEGDRSPGEGDGSRDEGNGSPGEGNDSLPSTPVGARPSPLLSPRWGSGSKHPPRPVYAPTESCAKPEFRLLFSVTGQQAIRVPFYAGHGVSECWLVDLPGDVLEVYSQPAQDGYRSVRRLRRGDKAVLGGFPDITFAVESILG